MSMLSIATSGLSAASLRLDVAASNIANATTSPTDDPSSASANSSSSASNLPVVYVPLQVNQSAQPDGGTVASVSAVSPGFVAQSDASAAPNVDLASQFVQLLTAKYAFAANAKVVQSYANTSRSLLDVLA